MKLLQWFFIAFFIPVVLSFPSLATAQFSVPQGGTGNNTFPSGSFLVGAGTSRLTSTTSPTVGYIHATSGTSTFPKAAITSAVNFLGDYVTNATTWVRSKIDAYLTGGTGVAVSLGVIAIDFTEFNTDSITEGSTNLFYTPARDIRFSTTSADYWKGFRNFFSTTSVDYWESTQGRWATTSSDFWLTQQSISTLPGGSDTQIQFNDAGSFGGDAEFAWNKTDNVLTIGGPSGAALVNASNLSSNLNFPFPNRAGTIAVVTGSSGEIPYTVSGDILEYNFNKLNYSDSKLKIGKDGASGVFASIVPNSIGTVSANYNLPDIDSVVSQDDFFCMEALGNCNDSGFSTTSADYWKTVRNFFSTTSSDYWKTQNNFFSTTSASHFSSLGLSFSTTSSLAHLTTLDKGFFFSSTSADAWGITKGYLTGNQTITLSGDVTGSGATSITASIAHTVAHWWTALQNFGNASTSQLTATSSVWLTSLATAGGTVLAVDPTGKIIATSTSAGGVTSVTASAPIFSSGGSTPNITWAGLATTSQPASSNLLVSNGGAGVYGVATSALSVSAPITFSGILGSQIGGGAGSFGCTTASALAAGCLSTNDWSSFNSRLSSTTVLLIGNGQFFSTTSANAWSALGLGFSTTSTDYWKTQNNFFSTTSSDAWGITKVYTKVATGSAETKGQLAFFLSTNGTPALLGSVATGTIAGSGGVTVTANQFVIGSGLTITCTGASAAATGCLSSTDWSSFNARLSTTTVALLDKGLFFSTTSINFYTAAGLAHSTTSVAYQLTQPITLGNATATAFFATHASSTNLAALNATTTKHASVFGNITFSTSTSLFASFASTTNLWAIGATTTSFFTNLASTSVLRGAGLYDCQGTGNKITYNGSTGTFLCEGDETGAGGGAWPFTPSTNFSVSVQSTSTPIFLLNGLHASSTSQLLNANFYGNVGIGTTTPWAALSIASSTASTSGLPLFAVSTSSNAFGFLTGLWATTTVQTPAQNPRGFVLDSGARFAVGTPQTYDYPGLLDQLTVNGRISTGDWVYTECNGVMNNGGASAAAATPAICGEWGFRVDTTAAIGPMANVGLMGGVGRFKICPSGISASLCTTSGVSGNGAGIFYPNLINNFLEIGTTTPVFEAVFARGTDAGIAATSTSYFLGLVNTSASGSSFETEPTVGCYLAASSTTGANWLAICRTSAALNTRVDTGIASTSNPAGTGQYIRLRIEASSGNARFYMATSGIPMRLVANITTNVPSAVNTGLVAGAIIANNAAVTPGPSLNINRLRLWYHQPALNY